MAQADDTMSLFFEPERLFNLALALLFVAAKFTLVGIVVYAVYFLTTLPWRRRERAAILLDLLELGQRDGRSAAAVLAELGTIQDRRLPVRLHLLSARLASGLPLEESLAQSPYLLPPEVAGTLQVGLRHGDATRTLEVCRDLLRRPLGRNESVLIYLLILCSLFSILGFGMIGLCRVVVLPKFQQVMADMTGHPIDESWQTMTIHASGWAFGLGLVLVVLVFLGIFSHLGGPRIWSPLDRLALRIPWRRDRIHRNFAAVLGLLLDSGVPETTAIAEAARATGHRSMVRRADRACASLRAGLTLPEAVQSLDSSGEFRWRLANACHGSTGGAAPRFSETLRRWTDALEARANQRESNVAQASACLLIGIFGTAVALQCIGIFGFLIEIAEGIA